MTADEPNHRSADHPGSSQMTELLERLAPKTQDGLVNVVIDTPRGSGSKFKYDQANHCYRLSRLLPRGMRFPFDFGSIPRTAAEDGDALDVVVLSPSPLFVGCLVSVKLIGVLLARQSEAGREIRNDRLLGVPVTEVNPPAIIHIDQLESGVLSDLEAFFASYNRAHGRTFTPSGRGGPDQADNLLRAAERRFGGMAA